MRRPQPLKAPIYLTYVFVYKLYMCKVLDVRMVKEDRAHLGYI